MPETPFFLEGDSGRLYCMIHRPEADPQGGLVICNPAFEERKSAQRALVEAARHFCGRGIAVLRFDYRGCGDSAGSLREVCPRDWIADACRVCERLAAEIPAEDGTGPKLGVLGLRFGATVAAHAAAGVGADFAVLWEPVAEGTRYLEQELRKSLVREMVTEGRSARSRRALLDDLHAGGELDFEGFAVTAAFYRGLDSLSACPDEGRTDRPVLIASVGPNERTSPNAARLGRGLERAGASVEHRTVVAPPFWNLLAYADCTPLFRTTCDWILERVGE
jgi:exosortase A-associated hydrolase 2